MLRKWRRHEMVSELVAQTAGVNANGTDVDNRAVYRNAVSDAFRISGTGSFMASRADGDGRHPDSADANESAADVGDCGYEARARPSLERGNADDARHGCERASVLVGDANGRVHAAR